MPTSRLTAFERSWEYHLVLFLHHTDIKSRHSIIEISQALAGVLPTLCIAISHSSATVGSSEHSHFAVYLLLLFESLLLDN